MARIITVVFTREAGGRLSRWRAMSMAVGISAAGSTMRLRKPASYSRSAVKRKAKAISVAMAWGRAFFTPWL